MSASVEWWCRSATAGIYLRSFFFSRRRRHTICLSDWSSDVCSSDLGIDWNAARQKYAQFLPHLATRNDLNLVIQWMCSELAVGHHRVGGGDFLYQPKNVPGEIGRASCRESV